MFTDADRIINWHPHITLFRSTTLQYFTIVAKEVSRSQTDSGSICNPCVPVKTHFRCRASATFMVLYIFPNY